MTRELTPQLTEEAGKLRSASPWIWLLEVEVPTSPPTRYRFAANPEAIVFDGQTYSPFPMRVGEVRQSADGDIPTIEVTIDNAALVIGHAVDQYDGLTGQPAKLILVNAADLGNPASRIEESGEVQSVSVSARSVQVQLSAFSLYRLRIPASRYVSRGCRWQFASAECGYEIPSGATNAVGGGFNFCRKSLAACRERGEDEEARTVDVLHPKRFGGAPGIPRQGGSI
jgi:lambda family phage minor tail protein L